MLQNLLVASIVIAAALFATWRLAGAGTRLRWLESLAARSGGSGRLAALLQRQIARRRAALAVSACGACGTANQKGHPPTFG